ncbi:FK506-binding protein 59 [Eufriesea mexicana]|uniref:peptidylprolyl isomerase n=1 Tax=Eufriesea mexicana TaxID=516756 RepID=A0A310SBV8_9HYME|nr:FK506-binding protein 59 [Eufriesea mexicana]
MTIIDISPDKDGGVMKEIIKEGIGDETPSNGSKVTVHYTGTLLDGTKFDSSRDRNEPFQFKLKRGAVIKAWNIGVATMKKGEIALLTCAPEYAYGKNGSPPKIPPNATLKFEIEMIDWKAEDLSPEKNGSIERYPIVQGKDFSFPEKGGLVDVHLTGMYNGKVFEDRDVKFPLEEGEEYDVIEGVEKALEKFKRGEKSKLKIKSQYAFKDTGKPEFGIPPNATQTQKMLLSKKERLEQAKICKERAATYIKANKYSLAIKMYKKVYSYLLRYSCEMDNKDTIKTENDVFTSDEDALALSVHLNLALCYLKTNQNVSAKNACNDALQLSPQNEKALFRRGQAYLALASPEIAIKDFQEVLKIQPKNTAAVKQIEVCNNLIKKQLSKEKRLYANMFDKFAQEDKQKEEEKLQDQPDVMCGALGEWGQEERPGGRDATAFEKENPNILMLNANGTDEFQNM